MSFWLLRTEIHVVVHLSFFRILKLLGYFVCYFSTYFDECFYEFFYEFFEEFSDDFFYDFFTIFLRFFYDFFYEFFMIFFTIFFNDFLTIFFMIFFTIFFLLLTIASFRIGVPSILFYSKDHCIVIFIEANSKTERKVLWQISTRGSIMKKTL